MNYNIIGEIYMEHVLGFDRSIKTFKKFFVVSIRQTEQTFFYVKKIAQSSVLVFVSGSKLVARLIFV